MIPRALVADFLGTFLGTSIHKLKSFGKFPCVFQEPFKVLFKRVIGTPIALAMCEGVWQKVNVQLRVFGSL